MTRRLWEHTSVELKHTLRFMMWVAHLSCYWKVYLAICIYRINKLGNFVYARWANLSDFLHVQLHTLVLMDCATMVILYLLSAKFQWKTCIASLRRFSLAKRWLLNLLNIGHCLANACCLFKRMHGQAGCYSSALFRVYRFFCIIIWLFDTIILHILA